MRFLLAVLLASFASAQATWIVDDTPGPGVHFTSLPAAVAAAASGDTLLVAPGHYEPFHVSGKALTILGDGRATTTIDGPPIVGMILDYVNITAPPVGTTFRLSGVGIRCDLPTSSVSGSPVFRNRLAVIGAGVSTAGTIVLTDVISEPATTSGGNGLTVMGITVHASRCVLRGGSVDLATHVFGAPGAIVNGGALFVADACQVFGCSVATSVIQNGSATGGLGLTVLDATAHLTRTDVFGGSATANPFAFSSPANGGAGLRAAGNTSVRVYGSAANSIRGGDAGYHGNCSAGAGIEAFTPTPVSVFGAMGVFGGVGQGFSSSGPATSGLVQLGLPPRPVLSLTGSAPTGGDLQASQPVTLRLAAPTLASPLFVLLADLAPGYFALPGLSGEPLLLSGSASVLQVGLLDAVGQWAVTFVPATQAPVSMNHPFHLQAFVFDPALGIWLGSNAELRRIR